MYKLLVMKLFLTKYWSLKIFYYDEKLVVNKIFNKFKNIKILYKINSDKNIFIINN